MKYLFIGGPADGEFIDVPEDSLSFTVADEQPIGIAPSFGDSPLAESMSRTTARYEKRMFIAEWLFALTRYTHTDIMRKLMRQYRGVTNVLETKE